MIGVTNTKTRKSGQRSIQMDRSWVGAGIHSTCLAIKKAICLPDHCSVFQAEICAIHVDINWLKTNRQSVSDVCILSDSQTDLRVLDSPHITSRSVLTYRISLDEIATQMNICLGWVPGHRDIPGKADELARDGTTTELQSLHNDYGIPIYIFGTNTRNRARPRTYSKLWSA